VESAAETRRRLAAETGRPDVVIEEAVRAAGGRVTRNEALFGRLRFDFVARRGEELRLVADVRHTATSAELTRLLDDSAPILLVDEINFGSTTQSTTPPTTSLVLLSSGETSITSALASIHSCSVTGLWEMTYLPSVCSSCQASRQWAGWRFFNQKFVL
jgi:hypothetical protein